MRLSFDVPEGTKQALIFICQVCDGTEVVCSSDSRHPLPPHYWDVWASSVRCPRCVKAGLFGKDGVMEPTKRGEE